MLFYGFNRFSIDQDFHNLLNATTDVCGRFLVKLIYGYHLTSFALFLSEMSEFQAEVL